MNIKPTHKTANNLEVDDWFRMGGTTYRVLDVEKQLDEVTIFFSSVSNNNSNQIKLSVDEHVIFKIYNQE